MKLEKCANGHFFDAEKFSTCPHCQRETALDDTVGFSQLPADDSATISVGSNKKVSPPSDDNVTVSFLGKKGGSSLEPVVGWLVCIKGKNSGKDYRLHSGRNFIGRNEKDVALTGEETVSREKHAVVMYEPLHNRFLTAPGESRELFYLNGELVISGSELKAFDRLQVGETELLFVPCCSDSFSWTID